MLTRLFLNVLLASMLLFASTSQAEPDVLNQALRAQEAGDYVQAANLFLPLAKNGNAIAQFNLGVLYTQGQVIQRNYAAAVQWYLAAAQQGHAQAQADIGELYATGKGTPQDYKKAMNWFVLSAKQGNASAQVHIGELYAAGHGVQQDYKQMFKWYLLASAQGNAIAQSKLAEGYASGLGVKQDRTIAIEWLNKAADNARNEISRKRYLAQRDEITASELRSQQEKQQQIRLEAARRAQTAEVARKEAKRIEAAKAWQALAAEQRKQQAAALKAQILAEKQAAIAAEAAKIKAIKYRAGAAARRKNELRIELARRRAEIIIEAKRHKRERIARAAALGRQEAKKRKEDKLNTPLTAKIHEHEAPLEPAQSTPSSDNKIINTQTQSQQAASNALRNKKLGYTATQAPPTSFTLPKRFIQLPHLKQHSQ